MFRFNLNLVKNIYTHKRIIHDELSFHILKFTFFLYICFMSVFPAFRAFHASFKSVSPVPMFSNITQTMRFDLRLQHCQYFSICFCNTHSPCSFIFQRLFNTNHIWHCRLWILQKRRNIKCKKNVAISKFINELFITKIFLFLAIFFVINHQLPAVASLTGV